MIKGKILIFIAVALIFNSLQAQTKNAFVNKKTRLLFLLDGSGSMLANLGSTNRWSAAVTLLNKIVDTMRFTQNVEVGLRVFGHNKPITMKDCKDTKLEVPFGPMNHKNFKTKLGQIRPLGYTSISQSLLASAKDFPDDKNSRNIIIIITDGIEECDGDPCAISAEMQKKGIILRPFIVGIGTDGVDFQKAYGCAGKYFNAQTEEEFNKVMGVIINQALNATSVQVSLLDNQMKPSETNVPITIYDETGNIILENFVHTLNGKGNPDTIYLDPNRKYTLVAHTVPPVTKTNVEVLPGKHNLVPIETPQGNLSPKVGGITKYPRLMAIVRKTGSLETVLVMDFNTNKQLITGEYDLEILSVPRIYVNKVLIKQSQTTTVEIPAPGSLQVKIAKDVVAQVFQIVDGKMKWVMDFDPARQEQNYIMQPGEYKVVYRLKSETRTLYSKVKEFKIATGTNTVLVL